MVCPVLATAGILATDDDHELRHDLFRIRNREDDRAEGSSGIATTRPTVKTESPRLVAIDIRCISSRVSSVNFSHLAPPSLRECGSRSSPASGVFGMRNGMWRGVAYFSLATGEWIPTAGYPPARPRWGVTVPF